MAFSPTLVSRGLDSSGAEPEKGRPKMNWPGLMDYEDVSSRVLALAATRNSTTKQLDPTDLAQAVTLEDSADWQVLEWDPQVALIVINSDADILWTTDPDLNSGAGGIALAASTAMPFHVAGSPNGRIYVRRAAAGQPVITGYGYGSRDMAYASRHHFETAPANGS